MGGFFGALELALGWFGVRPLLSSDDPLVGFAGNVPLFIEEREPDGRVMLRTAPNKLHFFNDQRFPKLKGPNSYRIFCMGGSTTFGNPYTHETSFCGWLGHYLHAIDPARDWQVVNAGGISYASYRIVKLMQELAQYQPDLFIVYPGQNEFLERRSYGRLIDMPEWVLDLNSVASGTHIYAAMKGAIDRLTPDSIAEAQARHELSGEVDDILDHTVGPTSYHRDDRLKQQILAHFRLNLGRMIETARAAQAAIVFVKPANNLKDMSPFKSEHRAGLTERQLAEWQDMYQHAHALQEVGDNGQALTLYRKAEAIDDRYAELHYRIGRAWYAQRDYHAAEAAYWRAVDEDIAPLRDLSAAVRIVDDVARRNELPLIDFPALLREAYFQQYDNAIFGHEYFIDHVHPTIEGHRLLSLALLRELAREGIAPTVDIERDARIAEVSQRVIAGLDMRDHAKALAHLGKLLDWAGKLDEARTAFLDSLQISGPEPHVLSLLGKNALRRKHPGETVQYLREAVRLDPDMAWEQQGLANVLVMLGEKEEALAHYRESLRVQPDNPLVHDEYATALADTGRGDEAFHEFNEALRLWPGFEQARYNLIVFLINHARYDEAARHNEELLRLDPEHYLAHNSLGIILATRRDYDRAIAHFSEALRLKPDYATAQKNLRETRAARKRALEF